MALLPNDPVTPIPPTAGINRDLPATAFPSVVRIQPVDLVGPEAANRQHAAIEKRTETLRTRMNQIIAIVNILDDTFLRKDATAARDGTRGPLADLSFNSKRLTDLAAPTEDTDAARLAEINDVLTLLHALNGTPVGMVSAFAGAMPDGWLPCDGSTYYPATDALPERVIGTDNGATPYPAGLTWVRLLNLRNYMAAAEYPWGRASPVPTVSLILPDYRGRVIIGAGSSGVSRGLTSPATPARTPGEYGGDSTHVLTVAQLAAHDHIIGGGVLGGNQNGSSGTGPYWAFGSHTSSTGSSEAHNNMQPYAATRVGIKF